MCLLAAEDEVAEAMAAPDKKEEIPKLVPLLRMAAMEVEGVGAFREFPQALAVRGEEEHEELVAQRELME